MQEPAKKYVDYILLEPITGKAGDSKVTISPDGLSNYLNSTYSFVLILIAITAVFYLIYGGMVYLTTDIANKQKQGKEIIVRVITGLVFVFSVWVILNSINPNILKNNLTLGIINTVSGTPTGTSTTTPPTGTPPTIVTCSEGLVNVSGITVCKSIQTNLTNMIAAAAKDGITLAGTGPRAGARSIDEQVSLRKQNCGTTYYDIYQKPSGQCTPPTAIPGTSNHEKGLAVDFRGIPQHDCSGATCKWLQANAITYGFKNDYASTKEYWHWSPSGR